MRSLTLAISKGGVGKSLLTANIGAALAQLNNKVVLVEGDPNKPLQAILGMEPTRKGRKLDDAIRGKIKIEKTIRPTSYDHLFLIPSGISLESYLEINPILFAQKLTRVEADYLFIDVPFPLGKAAFLSLGICEYFIMILTEDEFNLCVESALDTKRLGKYFLKCIPLGFIMNRIKTPERFTRGLLEEIQDLLQVPCLAIVMEDERVLKSYGSESQNAFLAYQKLQGDGFKEAIDKIAHHITAELPYSEKKDIPHFLEEVIKPLKL